MRSERTYLKAYAATYFFIFAAVAALFPFFPLLLQSKGLNPSQVGFLMGSYDLFSIIGLMVIGFFYDRIRLPRLTILGISLTSIIILFFLTGSENPAMLIPLTLTLGFFVKSPTSLLDAHYGQTIKNSQESYGKIRLGGSLGFLIAALIFQFTDWVRGSRPFSISAAYSLCMVVTMALIIYLPKGHAGSTEKKVPKAGFLQTVKTFPAQYWTGLSIAFLSALSMSGHYTFFSLLLKNKFNMENISGFWAIGPVFEIPLFFFSGFLLRKFKLRTLWIICLLAGSLRMQVYSLSTSLLPLYLIQVVHSLSFGLNHLCMISLINKKTPFESRGLAMSIYTAIGMGLSMFTGGILGGFILKTGDFPQLFRIFSIFPVIAIGISFLFLKEKTTLSATPQQNSDL